MADSTFEYPLGEYGDRVYLLLARASPSLDSPEEFAVTVYYADPERETNVEVARIDTAHGEVHFDRLYRRDEPKEQLDVNFWEAVELLEENWRTYAESHEKS